MAFPDWFRSLSPLEKALKRGGRPGADLVHELREADDLKVTSARDANALCDALEQMRGVAGPLPDHFSSLLQILATLFKSIDKTSRSAIPVLRDRGLPLLCELFNRGLADEKASANKEILFVLDTLALFCTPEGTTCVINAARAELKSESFLWEIIFRNYTHDHPLTKVVFSALKDPLPQGFIAVTLLDAANAVCLTETSIPHPFDTAAGATRLRQLLLDSNENQYSYAVSAAAALPYLKQVPTDALIKLALAHPHPPARLKTAWALARMQRKEGIDALAQFALDVNQSNAARRHLEELGSIDALPAEAATPGFIARATFAEWLAHPNELNRPPDAVEIVDHRELRWPPDFSLRPVWLLSGLLKKNHRMDADEHHVGMVGSVTFCLFNYELSQRPPEDGYALHCAWEMEREKLLKVEDDQESMGDYASLLKTWRGPALSEARVMAVAEIDPTLKVQPGLLGIAAANQNGQSGWAILGDKGAQFYPAADLPEGDGAKSVLKIEIGRRILGLPLTAARSQWLRPKQPPQVAETVAAYEEQLALFRAAGSPEQLELLKMDSPLTQHFESYIDSLVAARGGNRLEHVVSTYEPLFRAAKAAPVINDGEVFDSLTLLGRQFESYIEGLLSLGRRQDVLELIGFFSPYWQHNFGYSALGKAAFNAGASDLAESYFIKLKEGMKVWFRCEEIPLLARIWLAKGETERSKRLLLDALKGILTGSQDISRAEREYHEKAFQCLHETFLQLFPSDQSELVAEKIPASLLL